MPAADRVAELVELLPVGRAHAIAVRELGRELTGKPTPSVVRALIVAAQEAGFAVLSSPRAGVWIAANEAERVDVVDELGEQIRALQKRQQLVNDGRCAWRECRAELDAATIRRGGLYCRGTNHRFKAAADRGRRTT